MRFQHQQKSCEYYQEKTVKEIVLIFMDPNQDRSGNVIYIVQDSFTNPISFHSARTQIKWHHTALNYTAFPIVYPFKYIPP